MTIRALLCVPLLLSPAFAAVITETPAGAGNAPGTAQIIPGSAFTLPIPANVFSLGPTATLIGGLQTLNDVDFYSFTLAQASFMIFDMDNNPFTFDSVLSIFNSAGTLIANDHDTVATDPGSATVLDPYLGIVQLGPGTYFLAISSTLPNGGLAPGATAVNIARPDGIGGNGGSYIFGATVGDSSFPANVVETASGGFGYTLQISGAPVPEPSTISLIAIASGLLVLTRKRLLSKAR